MKGPDHIGYFYYALLVAIFTQCYGADEAFYLLETGKRSGRRARA